MRRPSLALQRRGRVLTVRIDNPPGDLLDATVIEDLDHVGRRLARDRSIRSVVITGPRPGVFVPHYDIAEIVTGSESLGLPTPYPVARAGVAAVTALAAVPGAHRVLRRTPAAGLVDLARTHAALRRLGALDKVVIAAIDGDALGGGCELALACDIRLMADGDYRIGLPEITAGIPPGAGGTQRLAAAIGEGPALAMVLQGRVLTPREALAAGLVDAVHGDVTAEAQHLAQRLAQWNPRAVRATKRAMRPPRGFGVEAAGFVATASHGTAVARLKEFVALPQSPWRDRSWLAGISPASAPRPARPSP